YPFLIETLPGAFYRLCALNSASALRHPDVEDALELTHHEAQRAPIGRLGQIHRDAFPDEERPLRRIVAGLAQDRVEWARVEVGRDEDDAIGDGAEDLDHALALGREGRGKIQLEEPSAREAFAETIGAAVEPGAEVDHLRGAPGKGLDEQRV